MSGQLVGEVIAASDSLRARGLSPRGFYAALAIAEKAHAESRQASVRWAHIRAALYSGKRDESSGELLPASQRTAERAVSDAKTHGVIRVVKPGFNSGHGRSCAAIYEIQPLTDPAICVAGSNGTDTANQLAVSGAPIPPTSGPIPPTRAPDPAT